MVDIISTHAMCVFTQVKQHDHLDLISFGQSRAARLSKFPSEEGSPSQDYPDYRTCWIIIVDRTDIHIICLEPTADRILVVVKLPQVPCPNQSTRRRTNPFLRHSKEFRLYLKSKDSNIQMHVALRSSDMRSSALRSLTLHPPTVSPTHAYLAHAHS